MSLSWSATNVSAMLLVFFSLLSLSQGFGRGGGGETVLPVRGSDTPEMCIAAELMHTYIKLHIKKGFFILYLL